MKLSSILNYIMDDDLDSKPKSNDCGFICFVIFYPFLVGSTFLSLACSWAYTNSYDASSNTTFSSVAAILTSIALCGCTFGCCGIGGGGKAAKTGLGCFSDCYNTCDEDNVLCQCCKILAACGLAIIIIPSFGTLQVVSGGLMVQSVVINTAINVKVFAAFIAAFDFLAAICGFICGCCMCSTFASEN